MVSIRRLILLCGLLVLPAGLAQAQPPVWVVHGDHATLVLFGSVHMLPPGLDWEPPQVSGALKEAGDVWFETPIDAASTQAMLALVQTNGVAPPGQTLDSQLSKAGRARLRRVARAEDVDLDRLQTLRPWWADTQLSLASFRRLGVRAGDGVEQKLSAQIPAGVARRAFETPEEQMTALASASEADQVAGLEDTLKDLEAGDTSYKKLLKAWMAGDIAGLKRQTLDPMIKTSPGVYRTLVVARNQHWMPAIRARLAGDGEALMVVGIGHLVGPDGLPARLRAEGYRVDGP